MFKLVLKKAEEPEIKLPTSGGSSRNQESSRKKNLLIPTDYAGEISINIQIYRYTYDTTLMAESEEELKSLLMKVKVESEHVGLQLNIQKTEIMASGPITSWEIDGETVETVSRLYFGGLQSHCRW